MISLIYSNLLQFLNIVFTQNDFYLEEPQSFVLSSSVNIEAFHIRYLCSIIHII
jgi:hypothetical protein